MSDETILKTLTGGGSIPFVDEDGASAIDHRRARSSVVRRDLTKEAASSRNVPSFSTFRSVSRPKISPENDRASSASQKVAMLNQREPQHRYARQSPSSKRNEVESPENPLQRYESAVLKYQKPKVRTKRQVSRDRQQQNLGYSSSDESIARNKSKSISSIDTQSVNNILDEYEDLDYGRSSDLSDVGSISVTNFEAVMMDQQKKLLQEKSRVSRMQPKCSPVREKAQPVLKVNQQTQVRQRSRERPKESLKDENSSRVSPIAVTIDSSRSKVPEVLLRKGEVQKRVDEWLNQAQSQNFPGPREKPLTRSNSTADQKSQRRYRQDSRSRSIDEGRNKLNGTSSSYDDLSRADKRLERKAEKVNVGVNTSRGTYKEYLALKNKTKQQDYGFSASSSMVVRSRDISPSTGSRIPQRGPLSSSFRSRRVESSNEDSQADNVDSQQVEKSCRGRGMTESRLTSLVKTRNESDHGRTAASVIPCRRASFKRSQEAQSASRALVKEETGLRAKGGSSTKGPGNLGDQGEPISPNKDGESRRPALTTDSLHAADKPTDPACKSIESSRNVDRPTRDTSRTGESESRYHRKDARIDQRMDTVYGAVGARVRNLQSQQVSKQRSLQGSNLPPEARKPPVLPRKDQPAFSQDPKKVSPVNSPQSSFKPNNRVYATLQQLNEQNSVKSRSSESSGRSCYSSNHVEKIYERSLQPQVIHADDLESVLRPSLQVSAYGDRESKDTAQQNEEEVYERELRYELETIEEDDQKSEASVCRYPEIGLTLKLPNGRPRGSDKKKEEPVKTFVTFQSSNSPQATKTGSLEPEAKREEPTMILEDFEVPYDPGNPVEGIQTCHTRENSNLSTATIPLDELESERQAKFKVEDAEAASEPVETVPEDKKVAEKPEDTNVGDNAKSEDRGSVVNEVLVKNLQFKQDLPKDSEHVVSDSFRIIEHGQQKPIVFHNVLCDDYENMQNARFKENKVYVTKEEMERQRMMDMLKKGDYDAVKAVSDDTHIL